MNEFKLKYIKKICLKIAYNFFFEKFKKNYMQISKQICLIHLNLNSYIIYELYRSRYIYFLWLNLNAQKLKLPIKTKNK